MAEWERLQTWASFNKDVLTTSNLLENSSINSNCLEDDIDMPLVIVVITAISSIGMCLLLVIKKRKTHR